MRLEFYPDSSGKQYKFHCLLLTGKSSYLLPLVISPIAFFHHLSYTSFIL